jgi:hypothetical protein
MFNKQWIGVSLALSLSVSVVGSAEAGVLAPARASDLASQTVFFSVTTACSGMTGAVELSGTPTPPPGKVFILTSYQWTLDTTGYPANFPIAAGLASVTDAEGINTSNIIAYSTTPNSGTGATAKNETIPNGVVAIRPSTGNTHLCLFPGTFGTFATGLGWVQGFFASDK